MLNLVERRLATIRPEEAARLLEQRNTYCGQRPRRQSHVDFLARKMKDGLFLNAEISYASLPDGSWALTNGAHTLAACRQSGVPFMGSIYGYECTDLNDLFTLYSESDQGARRNLTDVMRAGQNTFTAELKEIPHGQLALYGAAILMAGMEGGRPGFQSRKATPQSRVRAVATHQEEALFLHEFSGAFLLKRIPIRMAMVATFRADANRAKVFWSGVADPERLPATDPRRMLHAQLLSKECRRGTATAIHRTYSQCVHHWNAHATGSAVEEYSSGKTPSVMKPSAPIPLLATVSPMLPKVIPANQAKPGSWPMTVLSNVPDKSAVTTA
ncbi:MAG: hypothetical protein FWG74_08950 [Planctomycetes bacterium]|nr:hypothetical protein [Planctomycetota bacterium]